MIPQMRDCTCYVQRLSDMQQFSLHWGAHSLTCPLYRRSLDPVDAEHDREIRQYYEHIALLRDKVRRTQNA